MRICLSSLSNVAFYIGLPKIGENNHGVVPKTFFIQTRRGAQALDIASY